MVFSSLWGSLGRQNRLICPLGGYPKTVQKNIPLQRCLWAGKRAKNVPKIKVCSIAFWLIVCYFFASCFRGASNTQKNGERQKLTRTHKKYQKKLAHCRIKLDPEPSKPIPPWACQSPHKLARRCTALAAQYIYIYIYPLYIAVYGLRGPSRGLYGPEAITGSVVNG